MIQLPIDADSADRLAASGQVEPAPKPVLPQVTSVRTGVNNDQTSVGRDWSPSSFRPDQLLDYVVRMVTQIRREFGLSMDVPLFLKHGPYAREMITLALGSRDARLRAYATFLEMQMFSARRATRVDLILP